MFFVTAWASSKIHISPGKLKEQTQKRLNPHFLGALCSLFSRDIFYSPGAHLCQRRSNLFCASLSQKRTPKHLRAKLLEQTKEISLALSAAASSPLRLGLPLLPRRTNGRAPDGVEGGSQLPLFINQGPRRGRQAWQQRGVRAAASFLSPKLGSRGQEQSAGKCGSFGPPAARCGWASLVRPHRGRKGGWKSLQAALLFLAACGQGDVGHGGGVSQAKPWGGSCSWGCGW